MTSKKRRGIRRLMKLLWSKDAIVNRMSLHETPLLDYLRKTRTISKEQNNAKK